MLKVEYEKKEAMRIIGYSRIIKPENSLSECPRFWKEEYTEKYEKVIRTGIYNTQEEQSVVENNIGKYGLCISTCNDNFEYMIGGDYKGGQVPETMKVLDIPPMFWAIFKSVGRLPDSIQKLNREVWEKWYPSEGIICNPCGDATIEFYPPGDPNSDEYYSEVWIPIKNIPEKREK